MLSLFADAIMSKSHPSAPGQTTQEEALQVARATQKPGQTKEQTKLIAQGIAKGIELYKRQQSAKARERDKLKKRLDRERQARPGHADDQTLEIEPLEDGEFGRIGLALWLSGGLFGLMALAHAIRWIAGWELSIAGWLVPIWASAIAIPLLGGLALWLVLSARRMS
jgi:hypothetical protein